MTQPASPVPDFESAAKALRPESWLRLPRLQEAARLLELGRVDAADRVLRDFLKSQPRAPGARYLLAEVAARAGAYDDAELLLAQCVKLAPTFRPFRFTYAQTLLKTNKPEAALSEAETLLREEPKNPLFRRLRAVTLEATQNFGAAGVAWRDLLDDYPALPDLWLSHGHALRSTGAKDDSIAAYRRAIALEPNYGAAWWALADLKTFRFSQAEIEAMEAALNNGEIADEQRLRLNFALGKAYADQKLYENSFDRYTTANALYRKSIRHDPQTLTNYVARCRRFFTADFFHARAGTGWESTAPIFLVGMMRAGSTLVEQILASHSQIEGTRELSDLASIFRTNFSGGQERGYPDLLGALGAEELRRAGEQYLESTRAYRKLARPNFIDKMGANFAHVGLLQLILPNAKIVDVRRHPLACGSSIFAQLFPKGENDAYSLTDIGRHYHDYVELMAHFDRVLPGRVHRVFYENLVAEPEAEIRRLLAHLNLPFETACLEFHKTERVVATVSSEQVRTPLYRDALEQWRHYEPWLGPLKDALGPVLDAYPAVPDFD
jgi:tetratricopeptide (TPR) repeat protein